MARSLVLANEQGVRFEISVDGAAKRWMIPGLLKESGITDDKLRKAATKYLKTLIEDDVYYPVLEALISIDTFAAGFKAAG